METQYEMAAKSARSLKQRRSAAVFGAVLFGLAHVLPLAKSSGSGFFSVRSEKYWTDSAAFQHKLSRTYFSFGWVIAFVVVVAAVGTLVFAGRRTYVGAGLVLLAAAAFIATVATQSFVGPNPMAFIVAPLGALILAVRACRAGAEH